MLKDAIKAVGLYDVEVSLHSEVQTKVHINVARTETEAQDALWKFANAAAVATAASEAASAAAVATVTEGGDTEAVSAA